jgi:hypothetical protein
MTATRDHTPRAVRRAGFSLAVLGLLLAASAQAGLGEPVASVQKDHLALHGVTLAVTPQDAFDVHETTTADGGFVRQYASKAGTVFAVAWSGRTLPDLGVVLGKHYDEYLAAAKTRRGSHHMLSVSSPEVVMSVARLPRGFMGSAHVPTLLPPGVTSQDIR